MRTWRATAALCSALLAACASLGHQPPAPRDHAGLRAAGVYSIERNGLQAGVDSFWVFPGLPDGHRLERHTTWGSGARSELVLVLGPSGGLRRLDLSEWRPDGTRCSLRAARTPSGDTLVAVQALQGEAREVTLRLELPRPSTLVVPAAAAAFWTLPEDVTAGARSAVLVSTCFPSQNATVSIVPVRYSRLAGSNNFERVLSLPSGARTDRILQGQSELVPGTYQEGPVRYLLTEYWSFSGR